MRGLDIWKANVILKRKQEYKLAKLIRLKH